MTSETIAYQAIASSCRSMFLVRQKPKTQIVETIACGFFHKNYVKKYPKNYVKSIENLKMVHSEAFPNTKNSTINRTTQILQYPKNSTGIAETIVGKASSRTRYSGLSVFCRSVLSFRSEDPRPSRVSKFLSFLCFPIRKNMFPSVFLL